MEFAIEKCAILIRKKVTELTNQESIRTFAENENYNYQGSGHYQPNRDEKKVYRGT